MPSSAEATASVVVPSATTWTVHRPRPAAFRRGRRERSPPLTQVWGGQGGQDAGGGRGRGPRDGLAAINGYVVGRGGANDDGVAVGNGLVGGSDEVRAPNADARGVQASPSKNLDTSRLTSTSMVT